MSASIPIPGIRQNDDHDDHTPLMYEYQANLGGMSLPVGRPFPANAPDQHSSSAFGSTDDISVSSRDDIATSWPPRPSVRLVSRSARRWANDHRNPDSSGRSRRSTNFEPWDFSEVASATDQVQSAFLRGSARAERPPREGVSGTYFIRRVESKNSVLCVFKPVDEEAGEIERSPTIVPPLSRSAGCGDQPFSLGPHQGMSISPSDCSPVASPLAITNFNSYSERLKGDTPGFEVGEGALKEVAAYLLDHDHFARVPQTALATCMFESDLPEKNKNAPVGSAPSSHSSSSPSHVVDPLFFDNENNGGASNMRTKTGAFQVYVNNVGDADDFGPGVFSKDQVHSVAILDIRTLNCDRHSGNILVTPKKKSVGNSRYNIVPIDHGYILPAVVKNIPWPIWMDWSMIREPLSSDVKSYVARLDATSEARILSDELENGIRPGSLRSLKIATTLLKKGVAAGLTLYEIGLLIYTPRQFPEARSELQKIVEEAEDAGFARRSHISLETTTLSKYETENNVDRLPYRSSGCLPSVMSDRSDTDTYIDDFIVKYATKKISELVRRNADAKMSRQFASNGSGAGPFRSLGRARSIPDFGLGMRPVTAMFQPPPADGSAPTPASSPVATYGRPRRKPADSLASEGGTTPFNFSIESGLSIPVPTNSGKSQPRTTPAGNFEQPPVLSTGKSKSRSKLRPRHRRNASERNALDKIGSLEDHILASSPPHLDLDKAADKASMSIKRNLPPLFKPSRKASPVGPLDLSFWADDTGASRK